MLNPNYLSSYPTIIPAPTLLETLNALGNISVTFWLFVGSIVKFQTFSLGLWFSLQAVAKVVFEVEGKKIGVIHPHWGGPPWGIEEDIAREFEGVDIILFGHTHDLCHETKDNVVFLNPGQAYPAFGTPASLAVLTIGDEGIDVEIRTLK